MLDQIVMTVLLIIMIYYCAFGGIKKTIQSAAKKIIHTEIFLFFHSHTGGRCCHGSPSVNSSTFVQTIN